MAPLPRSSRARYREYRRLLKQRRREGGVDAAAHARAADVPRHWRNRPPTRSFPRLLVEFWQLLAGHRAVIVMSLITGGIATLLGLLPLYGPKLVFDHVLGSVPIPATVAGGIPVPQDRHALLAFVAAAMVALAMAALVVGLHSRWQLTRATKRVQVGIRKRVFDHAVHLPLHRVYELKSGGVASILREDAGGIAELIFSMLYNPWKAILQLAGSLMVLAFVDWRMLLGSLAVLPVVYLTHRTWIGRIRPIYRDIRMTRQQIDAQATEAFGGMRIVRSFSRQRGESARFTISNHLMARQELFAWWWTRGVDIAWSVLIPVATAMLLWYGGRRVLADAVAVAAGTLAQARALTVGDLVMFLAYLTALLGPVAALANSATMLQNNLAGLDRVLDLLAEDTEMPVRPGQVRVDRSSVAGHITFRSVSFAYPRSRAAEEAAGPPLVLADINLEVERGQVVALVGRSGAGKTTLCNLVARFYDPTAGAILLDGMDLRQIEVESYRRLLGIVEQDTFLFDGTIAQNIGYGRRGATMDQIIRAARLANAHEFIARLEGGYEALIGERGVKLSGGQRQRLTIARAILADPRILILDEATSNLDSESERLIQASLHTLMAGRTSFVIAHRLSTIAHADLIVVLEAGRIVETGSHEQLMARSGRYREMVELQTRPVQAPVVEADIEPAAELPIGK